MGLFQKAVETYDAMSEFAGKIVEGKEILAPVGHMIANAKIEITVDENGNFVKAVQIEEKIPIPCSEKSSGRSSGAVAHPLCDKVDYVAEIDEEKHQLYIDEMQKWTESEYTVPKLVPIYEYLKKGSVLNDCLKSGVISIDEKNKIKNGGDIVTWRVVGLGSESGAVYEDREMQKKYAEYYLNSSEFPTGLCMMSGNKEKLASQHLKGVSNFAGNAKIISSNDSSNFTYRGRFAKDNEALTMGYISSQKAHNMLKWLVSNEGVSLGNRRMVCWNPSGKKIARFNLPLNFGETKSKFEPTEYKEQLNKLVLGMKKDFEEPKDKGFTSSNDVIIAAFEAATPGRLSLTYYNELKGSDFLDRLYYWDTTCCWYSSFYGTSAPALYQIINCAFGTQRGGENEKNARFECDTKVFGQQMQRIIQCRIDKKLFPADIMKNIVRKAERLQIYTKNNREMLIFTACAVIRKYRSDNLKEEWKMSLEENRHDRSYQFGRLLAVMEKIERDTYSNDEKRETNAIRSQAFFVQRPQTAFSQIMTQIKTGYYPRLSVKSRMYYEKLIGKILEEISAFDENEIGKPLSETYLMGYYLQKNELYTKKENISDNENTEE